MTERSEITTILQGELAPRPGGGGDGRSGQSEAEPAVEMESVHHLMKVVAGSVNLRPAWFFDTEEQGEALGDVATHLVDLVPYLLFPGQPIDYRSDIRVLGARKWPTVLDRAAAAAAHRREAARPRTRLADGGRQARLLRERGGLVHDPGDPRPAEGALELRGARGRGRHARRDRAGEPLAGRDPAGGRAEVAARALRRAQPARRRAGGQGGARAPHRRAGQGPPRPHGRGRGRAAPRRPSRTATASATSRTSPR